MFVVGAPYEINSDNVEGAAYTYVNGGARYGIVIGTNECNITADRNLLLNGYLVPLTAGNATLAAQIINGTNITNIQASATADNKLIIQVINTDLSVYNEKLLVAADSTTLSELGIELYTNTQIVTIPHVYGQSQFGKAIKFNDSGSLLVSAPVGTRFAATTFDFTDDENLDNDTNYISDIKNYCFSELKKVFPEVKINGETTFYNILNVQLPLSEEKTSMLLFTLDMKGIAVSRGSACQSGSIKPSHVLAEFLSPEETKKPSLRISFSHFNTKEDIDLLVEALKQA